MTLSQRPETGKLWTRLAQSHFAFIPSTEVHDLLRHGSGLEDWSQFCASWEDLPEDTYMADGGRYRRRRHAAFCVPAIGPVRRKPDQPHYQSRDRNPLNGGIERWFGPLLPEVAEGATINSIFDFCRATFSSLRPEATRWHVEVHQFRIVARHGEPALPTPEGRHRDGVDFVFVLLVNRHNVTSGTTSISDLQGNHLGDFTLSTPLDAALVDDRYVFHGVTPIGPQDADREGHRDVLVLTWKLENSSTLTPRGNRHSAPLCTPSRRKGQPPRSRG